MIPTTGLHDGIPDAEYRAATGLSASEAKVLLGKRPPAPSPALAFGTLVHTIVLEPHKAGEYVALDAVAIAGTNPKTGRPYDSPTMTSKWKAAVLEAEQSGKTVVAQTDWDAAHRMAEAVHAHPAARRVLELCDRREVSGWAEHPSGVLVKGRLDLLGPGLVADLKTTQDANPDTFGKTCHDFGYHVSAANYVDIALAAGEDVQGFCFINVEKTEPYRVSVVQLADSAINLGRERMAEACHRWLELGRVELPQYGDGFHTVDLPPWAYRAGATTYEEIAS
jgi:hypothetical protein